MTMEEFGNIKTVTNWITGMAILKESYDKVFVPNFTTKSSGTGLGLAIWKQRTQLESMKGHIWFESTVVGEGTSSRCTLPYYHTDTEAGP
jgi:signal transduction histidine kinase